VPGYSALLHVDLSEGRTWTEPTEPYKKYIGGRGLNVGLLLKYLKPGVDALSPDNVLVFSTGPVGGTVAPSSARYNVSAKSPLTGFLGDSNSGGHWSAELRYAGCDGIIFYGRSPKPVYLLITDDGVKIEEAAELWGQDTWQTIDAIKEKYRDPEIKVACIGVAGEKLVRFACVMNEYGRAAGRTGMGAVMGSKNLKAIAVRGSKGVRVARPAEFTRVSERLVDTIRKSRQFDLYHISGVIGHRGVEDYKDSDTTVSLFFKPPMPGWGKLGGKEWWKSPWVKLKGCSSCQMHCSHFFIVREGPLAGVMGEGPEAETMGWITAIVGNFNRFLGAYGTTLVNRLGLDAIQMGAATQGLMTLYEKGVLTNGMLKELKAGWLRPNWGDPEVILSLMDMTAKRQGIGDLLAEGPNALARAVGGDAAYWLSAHRNMTAGNRSPQKGGVLNHLVSARGPDHLRGSPSLEFYGFTGDKRIGDDWNKYIGEPELFQHAVRLTDYEGKAALVVWQEHLRALSDSFGVCSFNYGNWPNTFIYPEDFAELYSAATGEDVTAKDMVLAAQRVLSMERAFNIREGWKRADDQPPERWVREPKEAGAFKGERVHLDKYNEMLDEYYVRRGWNRESGLPTRVKLEELGLTDVADELERTGKLG